LDAISVTLSGGLFREVLERAPLGVCVYTLEDLADDASLTLCYANPAASRMLGKDLQRLLGARLLEVVPTVSRERLHAYAQVCRERRAHEIGDLPYGAGVSEATILGISAVPVLERGVAILLENLTREKRSEDETRTLNKFLDSIIENIPAMVFVKEARDLRFERFNRAGEDLLGLSRGAMIGKTDYDFFPKEQADFFVQKDRETLARGTLEDIPEEPIETPRGTRWLHTRKIPIADHYGRPAHLLGISMDITERRIAEDLLRSEHSRLERKVEAHSAELKAQVDERARIEQRLARTEEQFRQAQKMEAIGRLAGGVAHDFNNLLSVILSYSELALRSVHSGDPLRDEIEQILFAGRRAAELTSQLLAFSRQQVLQPQTLDLGEVVRATERMLRRLIGEDIELAIHVAPEIGHVRADKSQIEQVVLNLVVNARDAMPTGGKLTIEIANVTLDEQYAGEHLGAKAGPHVMIAVTDTGAGMDRPTLARVFEPFFTTKEPGKGTGLGLATVLGIVQQSGGSIWVYSEPSRGAAFKVYLPEFEDERGPTVGRARSLTPALLDGNETVLLVEDEEQVRVLAAGILRRHGYRVIEARSPTDAIAFARGLSEPIQLLLTDVVMPEMGGRALAELLVQDRPELRVLFMSGYTDDAIVRHGVLESGVEFMQKPLTPERLLRYVRSALKRRPNAAIAAAKGSA
jgi:two-component system cell cycle sensor histidine kinase/response regulator CckA